MTRSGLLSSSVMVMALTLATAVTMTGCDQEADTTPNPAANEANNRGVGLMGQFDYEGAFEVFHGLAEADPDEERFQLNLAIAQLNRQREGDEAAALAIVSSISEANPDNLDAVYLAGILNSYQGRNAQALTQFQRVAEADPTDAHAAYYTGQCLAQAGQFEAALAWFERSSQADPYLRSAAYGAAQAARRLGQEEAAAASLALFEALADNPRGHLAQIKYTRMGRRAEARVLENPASEVATVPEGPAFDPNPIKLGMVPDLTSLSACDIDVDGRVDLVATSGLPGQSLVHWNLSDGPLTPKESDLPFLAMGQIRAVLWGDVDANGWPDVFLCRDGENQLWMQMQGQWTQDLKIAAIEGDVFNTVDGAIFDADHDGDLDIYTVNANGPNVLLNNNRDSTFRRVGPEEGLPSTVSASRQVLIADLDQDRDLDLIIINEDPPHEVWLNDRLWRYQQAAGFEAFKKQPMVAAVAGDRDANGLVELYSLNRRGGVTRWSRESPSGSGGKPPSWQPDQLQPDGLEDLPQARPQLALLDIQGNGRLSLLASGMDGIRILGDSGSWTTLNNSSVERFTPWMQTPDRGASLVMASPGDAGVKLFEPGSGRNPYLALSFSGRDDLGQSMRSNASGIGTRYAARIGSRWTLGRVLRDDSGPGQSLQPVAIGLGSAKAIDFLTIEWSEGVYQTELGVRASGVVTETQRQLSSCPVLFVRQQDRHVFVSDLLGVGGLGFRTGRDTLATPRPFEHFLLPPLEVIDGGFEFILSEPMEESCYLDAIGLTQYDLPPGWGMTLDERMGTAQPFPTGAAVFFQKQIHPVRSIDNVTGDVTGLLGQADHRALPTPPLDERFLGRLQRPHQIELHFDEPLDAGPGQPVLVLEGWVEYPYSQTCFAAWQAGATYDPPTIEARAGTGQWMPVHEHIGYPAGMPRQMSLPLSSLPAGADAIRMTSSLEIYWDCAFVVLALPCDAAAIDRLELTGAWLFDGGFPKRRTLAQKRPDFDWSSRQVLWDTRFQKGLHSRHGSVEDLVSIRDHALAIFGTGEAIRMRFEQGGTPLPVGWTRCWVLEVDGWCKDQDLMTHRGDTIEPLPVQAVGAAAQLHRRRNDRWMGGH